MSGVEAANGALRLLTGAGRFHGLCLGSATEGAGSDGSDGAEGKAAGVEAVLLWRTVGLTLALTALRWIQSVVSSVGGGLHSWRFCCGIIEWCGAGGVFAAALLGDGGDRINAGLVVGLMLGCLHG